LIGNKIKKIDRCSFGFFLRDEAKILLGGNQIVDVDVGAFENFTSQNASISVRNNLTESLPEGLFLITTCFYVSTWHVISFVQLRETCAQGIAAFAILYDLSRSGGPFHIDNLHLHNYEYLLFGYSFTAQ
jgi:hypothetical protein